jgi:predicted  nucleic acid-binding Zn-ribbon protein
VDGQLKTLIALQSLDTRIAGLEAEAARIPRDLEILRTRTAEAKKIVDIAKTALDAARKETRAKEKDLEDNQVKRQKFEGQLYQVKTNKEYSAVLAEIEEVKQQKSQIEEEILTLMERQERLVGEVKDTEARYKSTETAGAAEETALRAKLAAVETELTGVRGDRGSLAREVPANVLTDYDRLLRARGGLALVPVTKPNLCGACRMTVTPQRLQELRAQNTLLHCESCGRYIYWQA